MTEQVPHRCRYDGRDWYVEDWSPEWPRVPTNEQLGITTVMRSTANHAGRIDHFLVFRDQLYLFKVEAEVPEGQQTLVPFGARKEVRLIYEPLESHSAEGLRMIHREHRSDLLIFDDLEIDFTGTLTLLHPLGDPWDYPWPLREAELEPTHRAILEFEHGRLVRQVTEELDGGR